MGVWKKYNAANAFQDYLMRQAREATVRSYSDINGNPYTFIALNDNSSSVFNQVTNAIKKASMYEPLTAYPTSDTKDNYSENDYALNAVGTVTTRSVARNSSSGKSTNVYTLVVTNETSDSIAIGGVKFTKTVGRNAYNITESECLFYGYLFDSVLNLAAGETKTITVTFEAQ